MLPHRGLVTDGGTGMRREQVCRELNLILYQETSFKLREIYTTLLITSPFARKHRKGQGSHVNKYYDDDLSEKPESPTGGNDGNVAGGANDTRRQSRGSQMSFMRNFMSPADHETSPTSPIDYLSPNQAFTDNRMKKNAVLYPNGDRQSAVSLRDDEDYSRPVLTVRLSFPFRSFLVLQTLTCSYF